MLKLTDYVVAFAFGLAAAFACALGAVLILAAVAAPALWLVGYFN